MGASWIGVSDGALRQSGFTMRFLVAKADQREPAGITDGTVVGRLDVTDVGERQDITAPARLGSFADFELALDALGDAQEAKGGG